ncbi:Hypothetical predicted protein [Olea europaea subsp. europaea]|uniref:FCP1 homology domain-containing protein n=1 Tax=Olea europaea subsp. europaea TaxID=158383 RepID=A0A8S0UN24_OLEEU|nr:Hypothetical predicted protein [Olea europaea subsp. europaea]
MKKDMEHHAVAEGQGNEGRDVQDDVPEQDDVPHEQNARLDDPVIQQEVSVPKYGDVPSHIPAVVDQTDVIDAVGDLGYTVCLPKGYHEAPMPMVCADEASQGQERCTETRFNALRNDKKPLFIKELTKVWEFLEAGKYNDTNTLLLDDSPYKAVKNSENTTIFPPTYTYNDANDSALGPSGNLRKYLNCLAEAENMQELDNFDVLAVGEVAVEAQLYEEAFAIFKFNLNVQGINVLLDNIRDINLAVEFAFRVEDAKVKEVDSELVYAYAKIDGLGEIEEFILMPNVAILRNVGDHLYDEAPYEVAEIVFAFISKWAKLARSLVKLKQFQEAVDAKSVNTTRMEDCFIELISLMESGLGLERTLMGIFTKFGVLCARYRYEKLMEHKG